MNIKILFAIALSITLSACGSGGGSQKTSNSNTIQKNTEVSDNSAKDNQNNNDTNAQTNSVSNNKHKVTHNTQPQKTESSKSINDSIYEPNNFPIDKGFHCFGKSDCSDDGMSSFKGISQKDISQLVIAGETINLRPFKNIQEENYYYKDKENNIIRAVSGKKYDSVMFGILNGKQNDSLNSSNKNISATFVNGYPSQTFCLSDPLCMKNAVWGKEFPSTGVAKYHGDAFAIQEGVKGIHKGNADFTINFGHKSFNGELTNFTGDINDIKLHGYINTLLFEISGSGDGENSFLGDHYYFDGDFYGKDHDTIAGRLTGSQKGKDIEVVVGAKKQ